MVSNHIVQSQEVQTLEFRGRKIIIDLFDAFMSDPKKLLGETQIKQLDRGVDEIRVICDYVAGMTDVFATRFHERLFGTRQASVFERI